MKLWLLVLLALASGVAAEPLCSPSKPTPIASGTYGTPRTPQVVRAWQLGRQFDRVLIVVLENMDYGNSIDQPYFKELAARGNLLTRYKQQPRAVAAKRPHPVGVPKLLGDQ